MCPQPLTLLELSERLKRDERLLGLDVGTKTIGLALSDVMRRIATPLETIRRVKFSADAARLLDLARQHGVGGLSSACRSTSTAPRGRARNRPAPSPAISPR